MQASQFGSVKRIRLRSILENISVELVSPGLVVLASPFVNLFPKAEIIRCKKSEILFDVSLAQDMLIKSRQDARACVLFLPTSWRERDSISIVLDQLQFHTGSNRGFRSSKAWFAASKRFGLKQTISVIARQALPASAQ